MFGLTLTDLGIAEEPYAVYPSRNEGGEQTHVLFVSEVVWNRRDEHSTGLGESRVRFANQESLLHNHKIHHLATNHKNHNACEMESAQYIRIETGQPSDL